MCTIVIFANHSNVHVFLENTFILFVLNSIMVHGDHMSIVVIKLQNCVFKVLYFLLLLGCNYGAYLVISPY